ncbi:MAG: pyridoxamine 5'-phosphate oxidase family protein [Chloroflexi bacterium]|nr:pyridoxamine 5'-phosphate oxidase family protein [Chloroflexota bacterium]
MLQLTDEWKQAINSAIADGAPIVVGVVDASGQPLLSFRGSTQVHSDDQLAIWVRNPDGGILRHVQTNPHIAFMYRNPATRLSFQLHGRATRVSDSTLRQLVYDRAPEVERNLDPEVKGVALLVNLDRVIHRGEVVMSRDYEE